MSTATEITPGPGESTVDLSERLVGPRRPGRHRRPRRSIRATLAALIGRAR